MEETITLSEPLAATGEKKRTRLYSVDIAKGILILEVVLGHAWFAKAGAVNQWFPYSMPAFFLLAGYVYKPGRTYLQNMGRRVLQLLVPYVLFSIFCNLLYPVYAELAKVPPDPSAMKNLWIACLKSDAFNMLMSTPMWFLTSLFTASIVFFALVDRVRKSLLWTAVCAVILLGLTVVIEIVKKGAFVPWHLDYALFGCAMMLMGAYFGQRGLFTKFSVKNLILGIVLLAACMGLNEVFPNGKTSVVQYITTGELYGVGTNFVISLMGSIGLLCVCTLLEKIPVFRPVFCWLGRSSLWILCIHYAAIMIIELWLFNHKVLSNSIIQVIMKEMYGWGLVRDTTKDIIVKVLVAFASIGIGGIYAVIHNAVKKAIKSKRAA